MRRPIRIVLSTLPMVALLVSPAGSPLDAGIFKKKHARPPTPLDEYLRNQPPPALEIPASPGSLYTSRGRLADTARDLRASQIDDLVTVTVSDKASAVSSGVTNSSRKSSVKASVNSIFGPTKATGALANLASTTGDQQLQGQGTTSRQSALTTTVTARVRYVTQSGNMVIEGRKEIVVNSERQVVTVRGIVRPADLTPDNRVPSDRVADLQIWVEGKGVVADAVKRPFILYRLLLGLLPF